MENHKKTFMKFKLGDYFVLGNYRDRPILWRCVAFHKIGSDNQLVVKGIWSSIYDKNDKTLTLDGIADHDEGYVPLLVSDQILCYKVFDACGEALNGSHIKLKEAYKQGLTHRITGSPIWGDSNIRCWLNSDKAEGEVVWICGNPPTQDAVDSWNDAYDREPGFLHGFMPKEVSLMRSVSQETKLPPDAYVDMNPYYREVVCTQVKDDEDFNPREYLNSVVKNEASRKFFELLLLGYEEKLKEEEGKTRILKLYTERFTDKVFLLSDLQWKSLCENRSVLGPDYHKAKYKRMDTGTGTFENRYVNWQRSVYEDGYIDYWLRSPKPNVDSDGVESICECGVHVITTRGDLTSMGPLAYSVGIRPAFYLEDIEKDTFKGDGTIESPFILE